MTQRYEIGGRLAGDTPEQQTVDIISLIRTLAKASKFWGA
jgi:hypothetical protein